MASLTPQRGHEDEGVRRRGGSIVVRCKLTNLAHDLAQVVSEPIFDVPRLVEAACHQRFDPLLGGRSTERSDARIPPGAELNVRRQAGVDEALGLGDRPFVELGDAGRK